MCAQKYHGIHAFACAYLSAHYQQLQDLYVIVLIMLSSMLLGFYFLFAISTYAARLQPDSALCPQVVGRVHLGKEVLDQLSDTPTLPNDAPVPVIKIMRCGATNSTGAHDSLEEALGKETAEQAAARLQQESLDTRSAIM